MIISQIKENGSLKLIKEEHRSVFSCALENPIAVIDHIKMVAAIQPFVSGCISKTINMPEESTIS